MNRDRLVPLAYVLLAFAACLADVLARPIMLHGENPHYFRFRNRATVLIGSGEHYGAVVNLDFDYVPYLEELRRHKLNLTRVFTGAYVEPQGAFNIAKNTLAPAPGHFIAPWARSDTPGYANGGNKFDLKRWDDAYFKRLKDFVHQAARRGVVVEVNLFCPFYDEPQWQLSPFNITNNVNNLGNVARTNVYTLDQNGGLFAIQEALVRKVVTELESYDNVYYEVCNEPYFGGVTMSWQRRVVDIIVETNKQLKNEHIISMNIANGSEKVQKAHPYVSIFNFHYAQPATAVAVNWGLHRVIGDNETGFRGTNNLPYRVEGWEFLLAGGALFNHLDYSFTTEHEGGTFVYPATQPGGGNAVLRQQLSYLMDFMESLPFVKMKPDTSIVQGGIPAGFSARALVETNRTYAIYLGPAQVPKDNSVPESLKNVTANLSLTMPAGQFIAEWINPRTGQVDKKEDVSHQGGVAKLTSPIFDEDIALRIKAK